MGLSRHPSQGKILFICGSINQTTQLHQVAEHLGEYEHFYSPYYGDRFVETLRKLGLLESTIGGNKLRARCLNYLHTHGLHVDEKGLADDYDLIVTSSDVVMPLNTRDKKVVMIQEGILDPEGNWFQITKRLPFMPRWLAGTAWTGTSGLYDVGCVASEGYRELLIERGVPGDRVVATGIPNFDNCERFRASRFPYSGFVLACTSDGRETFKRDDRRALLEKIKRIANGRRIIVKLHPNEKVARATAEIERWLPGALVFATGCAEDMIARCDVLITEWSSTAFVGVALGKEVHSNYPPEELHRLMPIQNGGTSSRHIAELCRGVIEGTREQGVLSMRRGRAPSPLRRIAQ